jgi:hypothetical protein
VRAKFVVGRSFRFLYSDYSRCESHSGHYQRFSMKIAYLHGELHPSHGLAKEVEEKLGQIFLRIIWDVKRARTSFLLRIGGRD